MRTRLELHNKLCEILGTDHVYFRKPSKGMKYPCMIYDLEGIDPMYADNISYIEPKRWSVIVIDGNPDSKIPGKLGKLPYCRFDRSYQSDGLNHFVYTLYY